MIGLIVNGKNTPAILIIMIIRYKRLQHNRYMRTRTVLHVHIPFIPVNFLELFLYVLPLTWQI